MLTRRLPPHRRPAVVVAAAAALAVTTRSLPVAIVLVAGLTVDIAAAPDLATTEHLLAVVVGVSFAMAAGRWRTTRSCTTSSLRPGTQAVR